MLRPFAIASAVAVSVLASSASAAIIYTETFATGNSNWTQAPSAATPAFWVTGGGPAGFSDTYITGDFNLTTATSGFPVIMRATGSANASGGAFTGSYADIDTVSFYVRHSAPVPLPVGLRLGSATPGTGLAFGGPLVEPNVWTLLTFDIDAANPNIVTYEGTPGATNDIKFANATSNVANLQLYLNLGDAAYTPPAAGTPIQIDVDTVSTSAIPEPASAGLALVALPLLARRRRA